MEAGADKQQQQQQQQQQQSQPENLLLSFENPNYQFEKQLKSMDQARIDDHLNSNIEPNMYEELCKELKLYTELSGEGIENNKQNNRWTYAQLNPQTMGVLSSPQTEKEVSCEKEQPLENNQAIAKSDQKDNDDTGVGGVGPTTPSKPAIDLEDGWEMHEDEGGLYFWHVKSGTIQREIPKAFKESTPKSRLTKSTTSSNLASKPHQSCQQSSSHQVDVEIKRKSLPPPALASSPIPATISDAATTTTADPNAGMQVRVRSLGSIQLSEESLTNENSSKAVNRCIVQLSTGSLDSPECKELILSLTEGTLKLVDPTNGSVVSSQPIHTIRVWGVGRDDSRDFAYVARDKATRCHTCHVFRCEVPARAIANKLRDICKKILIERSLSQSSSISGRDQDQSYKRDTTSGSSRASSVEDRDPTTSSSNSAAAAAPPIPSSSGLIRPTHFTSKLKTKTVRAPESFPTPMEEPKKIIKAKFIGDLEIGRPGGMDVINEAIELSENKSSEEDWELVNVGIAPSTITVSFADSRRSPIDCRVRFLSFLGIGQDPRKCAFIVHTAQDTFVAYVFHCEPHSGPLCKSIEAACTLRYQKCLDARPQRLQSPSPLESSGIKGQGDQPTKSHTTIKKALKTIFFGGSST